jgi:hypothetical protein
MSIMSINYPTLSAAADLAHFKHFSSLFTHFPSTPVENVRQINPFYAKQTQFQKCRININAFITMRYGISGTLMGQKTNPIQTQFKPNKANNKPNLTQFKANSNPISEAKNEKSVTFGAADGTYIQYLLTSFPGKGIIKRIQGRSPVGILDQGDDMRMLKFVWKCWCRLWRPCHRIPTGINSHKWESKIEILRNLSNKRY